MSTALLIDFGSTFTKVTVVDLDKEEIIKTAQAITTIDSNIMIGLNNCMRKIDHKRSIELYDVKLACSSAAGGLKMVAIGLVPNLTAEASKRAALGAGAKIQKVYSYKLSSEDILEIDELEPDIILLSGGTDGGEENIILHNAKKLADCEKNIPFVVACNKVIQEQAAQFLMDGGKEVFCTENVMPDLNKLNVEPCRNIIRNVFMSRIIQAKGLDKAQTLIDKIVMPTPAAVLQAAKLLSEGTDNEDGWGDLIVVDPGGATTDVHSLANGEPTKAEVMFRGLPEPFAKRTVEGDLGLRYSASSLLDVAGIKKVRENIDIPDFDVVSAIKDISNNIERIPQSEKEYLIDEGLAKTAISLAVDRHVGRIQVFHTPFGPSYLQYGKDLTQVPFLIGTGGSLVYSKNPYKILKAALFNANMPTILKPINPSILLDTRYIMASIGLLSEVEPDMALRILKKYIVQVGKEE